MAVLRGTNAILADAVADALADASLSLHLEPVRAYLPTLELTDSETLHCTVIPRHRSGDISGQGSGTAEQHTVDVVIQQRLKPAETGEFRGDIANDEVDPLLYLAEEVADFFLRWRPTVVPALDAVCTATGSNAQAKDLNSLYEPSHLKTLHQITIVVTLRFEVQR